MRFDPVFRLRVFVDSADYIYVYVGDCVGAGAGQAALHILTRLQIAPAGTCSVEAAYPRDQQLDRTAPGARIAAINEPKPGHKRIFTAATQHTNRFTTSAVVQLDVPMIELSAED